MARVKRGHHLLGIFLGGKTIPLIYNTPLFTKDIITYHSNKFLEDFAAYVLEKSKDLKIFGITGTNGKTSTKD